MDYCKLCDRRKEKGNLRQVDSVTAQLVRNFRKNTSFSYHSKVCTLCIKQKLQQWAENEDKILEVKDEYVYCIDKTTRRTTDAVGSSLQRSSINRDEIKLHLRYITEDSGSSKKIISGFRTNSTIEDVMRYLVKTLDLKISIHTMILTTIKTNDKTIRDTEVYASSQTLSNLNIEDDAYLYFESIDTDPAVGCGETTSPSSGSNFDFSIMIKYSKAKDVRKYEFNHKETVGTLLSFLSEEFQLQDVDKSCLQLSSERENFDLIDSDTTLFSLGIGKKYSELELHVIPKKRSSPTNNGLKNQPSHIVIKCYFSPQEITVDLSTIHTEEDLKQKIINALMAKNSYTLKAADINLTVGGKPFGSTHNDYLSSVYDIKSKSDIKAELNICPNIEIKARTNENDHPSREEKREVAPSALNIIPKRADPVGLRNLGNTCFLNSALQCLSHVVPLTSFFLSTIAKERNESDDNPNPFEKYGEVSSVYARFIWNMWKEQQSSFSPNEIREAIGKIAPRFTNYEQQDAHEFMIFLLSALNDEMKTKNNDVIQKLFYGTINSVATCLQCKKSKKTSNVISFLPVPLVQYKRSFIVHYVPFSGNYEKDVIIEVIASGRMEHLLSTFVEHMRLYNRRFYVLSHGKNDEPISETKNLCDILEDTITICDQGYDQSVSYHSPSNSNGRLTLIDCIREFLTLESIGNTRLCKEYCHKQTNAVKQMKLDSLPPVLIIQLKRFTNVDGYRRKLTTLVEFPLNDLNLNDFLPDKDGCAKDTIYDLITVSNHMGSIDAGHYTAFARQEANGSWYEFDDTHVYRVQNNDRIVSSNAYLLIYLRRNNNSVR